MEIDDFTIFIGPQTSGKSTIAKSVFFFLSLRDDMFALVSKFFDTNNSDINLSLFNNLIDQKFDAYWGNISDTDWLIKFYYSKDCFIVLEDKKGLITHAFSDYFIAQITHAKDSLSDVIKSLNGNGTKFLTSRDLALKESNKNQGLDNFQNNLNGIFGFDGDLLFIPASRSILAILSDQMQYVEFRHLDYLMRKFIDRVDSLRRVIDDSDKFKVNHFIKEGALDEETLQLIKALSQSILKGSYYNDEDGDDKIRLENGNYIKLLFASSGQQEAVWIIQMILLLILNKQKVFIVIEEPEAHLFPEAQKNIINLITLLANVNDNQVFITTHSPYLLTSLNNLVYAYQVGQKHPEKVSEIVDKQLWLNPEKLQAYFVGGKHNKGRIRSIIHPELQIIQTEEIDSASSINNEEYDLLFDLE